MTARIQALFGIALILVGAVKAWSHAVATSTLTVPGCLGNSFVIQLDTPLWHSVHCWGCYVALFGLGLALHAVVRMTRAKRNFQSLRLD